MAVEHLTFDPDGDLLLRLTYPPEEVQPTTGTPSTTTSSIRPAEIPPTCTSLTPPRSSSSSINEEAIPPRKEVDMLVSSKHLMLASPVFKAMLWGNFREGQTLKSTGRAEVPLPDDDPIPFKILLNIVHGFPSRVPAEVDLATLAGLSILVDKYQMLEVVSMYVNEIWMPGMRETLPENYNADFFSWLSITWVFKLSCEFVEITDLAVWNSSCKLEVPPATPCFPIPDQVMESIEIQRTVGISKVLSTIQTLISASSTSNPITSTSAPNSGICNENFRAESASSQATCDGMMLGTLLRSASAANLYPPPAKPYKGMALKSVVTAARDLQIVSLCDVLGRRPNRSSVKAHGQLDYIARKMNSIKYQVETIKLSSITLAP